MSRECFELKGVKSPWNGEYYIGFVLDLLNDYLMWEADYYLPLGYGPLGKLEGMVMVKWDQNSKKSHLIKVRRIGEEKYEVLDFPDNMDFSDFERRAQGMWDKYYARMELDYRKKVRLEKV